MTPKQLWNAYCGIIRKQLIRILRMWQQAYLPSIINTSLYMVIFGAVLGSHIGDINGFSYMSFLTPGLVMMAVIINAYTNVVSSFYLERFMSTVTELIVSPTPAPLIISGYVTGGIFRGVSAGLVVALICRCFTPLPLSHPGLAALTLLLTSSFLGIAGFINALFARKFDDTAIVTTFILTPLIYVGGIFFDESRLPTFWRELSALNPLHYIIQLFRYSVLGYSADFNENIALAVLLSLNLIAFIAAWALLKRGVGIRT
jgi:ABC-2 type transport system permease protein